MKEVGLAELGEKETSPDEHEDSNQSRGNDDSPPNKTNGRRFIDEEKDSCKDEKTEDENNTSEAGRRSSTRLRGKRPKMTEIITTSDEDNLESDEEYFERKEKERKRGRKPTSVTSPTSIKERKTIKKSSEPATKPQKEFSSGAFVVLKTDFHASMTPPIWKIDGKALLQKFIHFDQNGQTLYKNTTTYSGWTANNQEQYYPATVKIKVQNRKETIVKFERETIIDDDSD